MFALPTSDHTCMQPINSLRDNELWQNLGQLPLTIDHKVVTRAAILARYIQNNMDQG